MDPVSDEHDREKEASSDAGFSQSDIDALFDGSGDDPQAGESGAAIPPTQRTPEPRGSGAVNQKDLDALFDGSGATPQEEVASESGHGSSVVSSEGPVSPADIDALVTATQAAKPPVDDEGASSPDTPVDSLGRPFDEAAAAMAAAIEEERGTEPLSDAPPATTSTGSLPDTRPLELADLTADNLQIDTKKVSMLNDVNLRVKLQLGKTKMLVEDILNLGEGSVVELDKLAGDPIDVLVNDRLIARGEVLVLNDNFCVRISEVLTHDPHRITA